MWFMSFITSTMARVLPDSTSSPTSAKGGAPGCGDRQKIPGDGEQHGVCAGRDGGSVGRTLRRRSAALASPPGSLPVGTGAAAARDRGRRAGRGLRVASRGGSVAESELTSISAQSERSKASTIALITSRSLLTGHSSYVSSSFGLYCARIRQNERS